MKLQIFSDVHLEFGPLAVPKSDADVIIAAGDIGAGLEGLEWLKQFDKPVIYVLGNHEYWGQEYNDYMEKLWVSSGGTNIYFLENESAEIDGVRFLGCTLWTDYNNVDPHVMNFAMSGMNDFRYITEGDGHITPLKLLEKHTHSRTWLHNVLSDPYDGKTVVVTHHAPTFKSWHRDSIDILRYYYCSNLENFMKNFDIELWVHGHIHEAADYTCNGVRVFCNPRGYTNYETVAKFSNTRIIEV